MTECPKRGHHVADIVCGACGYDPAEDAYWAFDADRKGYLMPPMSERDAFKKQYRIAMRTVAARLDIDPTGAGTSKETP